MGAGGGELTHCDVRCKISEANERKRLPPCDTRLSFFFLDHFSHVMPFVWRACRKSTNARKDYHVTLVVRKDMNAKRSAAACLFVNLLRYENNDIDIVCKQYKASSWKYLFLGKDGILDILRICINFLCIGIAGSNIKHDHNGFMAFISLDDRQNIK